MSVVYFLKLFFIFFSLCQVFVKKTYFSNFIVYFGGLYKDKSIFEKYLEDCMILCIKVSFTLNN